MLRNYLLNIICWLTIITASLPGYAAIIHLTGDDFRGGGAQTFGHSHDGCEHVNYIYARPNGAMASMSATFELSSSPVEPMAVEIYGQDDDATAPTHIEISINGVSIFAGSSGLAHGRWSTRQFAIPDGLLRAGKNSLTLANTEAHGTAGNPPWFMISKVTLAAPAAFPIEHFQIEVPRVRQGEFPAPLKPGAPQFKLRGIKGYSWPAEQYLREIPFLKKAKMNFLMNCYESLLDEKTRRNFWWKPFSDERKSAYASIAKACQQAGITFCFAMHPQINSDRPLNLNSQKDFEDFFAHFAWMQSLGVKWFSVSMDDVGGEDQAAQQARFCNKFLQRLREKDPQAQLIFCPSVYATSMMWGHEKYLPALAMHLDKDIYVFWTGPDVVSLTISREDAEHFRKLIGHRLIIWDNYPVNDGSPTLHLGPITGRDPELCQVADGYMANPMFTDTQIEHIPLYTMADYAYNPVAYDPLRSVGQAIAHLERDPQKQQLLAQLVETYPGDIAYQQHGTGFNSVLYEYARLDTSPSGKAIGQMYIDHLQALLTQFRAAFPDQYANAAKRLDRDIAQLRQIQNQNLSH